MSELTPCNYCSLRRMRAHAEAQGRQVSMVGQNAYEHDPGQRPEDGKFRAWFMALTNHCVC